MPALHLKDESVLPTRSTKDRMTGGDRDWAPPVGNPVWLRRDGADWLPE